MDEIMKKGYNFGKVLGQKKGLNRVKKALRDLAYITGNINNFDKKREFVLQISIEIQEAAPADIISEEKAMSAFLLGMNNGMINIK